MGRVAGAPKRPARRVLRDRDREARPENEVWHSPRPVANRGAEANLPSPAVKAREPAKKVG